jgi:two-component system, OmpR family, sensor histidine kinase SenX3
MRAFRFSATRFGNTPILWIAVLCILPSLLGLVGVMQYRATTQLSYATEARIGGNVESLMMGWQLDLYHHLSAICVALQVGPDSGAFDDWAAFSDRYEQWRRTAEKPDLVPKLYLWQTSQKARPQLFRLDSRSRLPQLEAPDPKVAALLLRLQARAGSLYSGLRAWQLMDPADLPKVSESRHPSMQADSFTGWQFDQDVPAIVHPIVHHRLPSEADSPTSPEAIDWIIVMLDLNTIQNQLLPELSRRHFETAGKADYAVLVATLGDHSRTLYQSSRGSRGNNIDQSDAAMNIFGPPPLSTEDNFWEAVKNANAVKVQNWHHFSAPIWFPVFQYSAQENPWVLILTHRSGRLEDVIAEVRRVNLFASGAVLLLLAASVSLVAMAALRARNFARLQMDFVASISHELRTPLTAIYSAGENLADGIVETKPQLQHYGSIVTAQARQLMELVDQILTFASTRKRDRVYDVRPLEVSSIVELALRNSQAVINASGFSVEQEIEPNLPPVDGDLRAIASCLQNLLVNSVKYSGESRKIRVTAKLAPISGKHEIRISVEDLGTGIRSSDLAHIFKPFYRSPEAKSAQIHGTGLGLAVAKEVAEAMGGNLSVKSVLGVGSTFTLHLPIR